MAFISVCGRLFALTYSWFCRKALFLSRLSRREEAIESALLSILGFPWNWSAWTLLGSCIGDGEEVTHNLKPNAFFDLGQLSSLVQLLPLPPSHPLVHMFQIKTLNELHNPSEHELNLCDRLLSQDFFPDSLWVMSLRACVLYHLHGSSVRSCIYFLICIRFLSGGSSVWTYSVTWSISDRWYRRIFKHSLRDRQQIKVV